MRDLVIVGAGGHGRETLDVLEAINAETPTWNFAGFIDDGDVDDDLLANRGAQVIGDTNVLESLDAAYVIAIGWPPIRANLDRRLSAWGRQAATLIHPAATVASDNVFGKGVVLAAGARVTTNVHLGRDVHLNVNAVVSHDSRIGDHTTLSPGVLINGSVTIGHGVFLGTGAIVTPGRTIGDGAIIGAGSVVVADVPPGVTVKGVPGRW